MNQEALTTSNYMKKLIAQCVNAETWGSSVNNFAAAPIYTAFLTDSTLLKIRVRQHLEKPKVMVENVEPEPVAAYDTMFPNYAVALLPNGKEQMIGLIIAPEAPISGYLACISKLCGQLGAVAALTVLAARTGKTEGLWDRDALLASATAHQLFRGSYVSLGLRQGDLRAVAVGRLEWSAGPEMVVAVKEPRRGGAGR